MEISQKIDAPRILIVGWDGACPRYFFSLAEQGKLPTVQKLLASGAGGILHSTVPPLTPTAWTTFMTGVHPGRHGLIDFIELCPDSYEIRFTNVSHRRAPSLWRILNQRGYSVGVYNVPMTYPPEEVEGFLVSGLDTPDRESPFVWPRELKKELWRRFGGVPLDPRHLGFMRSDGIRRKVLEEIKELEKKRVEIFLWLLDKFRPDVAMIVFTATDTVQHFFWHYADPEHPWFPGNENPFGGAIEETYIFLDKLLAELWKHAATRSENLHLVMMSDHGFGPTSPNIFYPNRFLRSLGLLSIEASGTFWARMDDFLRGLLPPWLKGKLAARVPSLRVWWEKKASCLTGIDWKNTKAFCLEILAIPLGFWIHTRERFPQGILTDALEYEKVVRTIIGELSTLGIKAFHRDEVYRGPYAHLAPDVLIDWWQEGLVFGRSFPAPEGAPVLEKRIWKKDQPAPWTGTHRREGIWLVQGPQVKKGIEGEASLEDLAPTIFALLKEPIPSHFEGQVLRGILRGEERIERATEQELFGEAHATKEGYSEEEAEAIKRKLQSLGYL